MFSKQVKIFAFTILFLLNSQTATALSLEDCESDDPKILKELLANPKKYAPYQEYIQGNIFFLEKDFTKAEQEYRKALSKMPVYGPLCIKLAKVLEIQAKDLDEAEELAIIALHTAKEKDFSSYLKILANIRLHNAKQSYYNNFAISIAEN